MFVVWAGLKGTLVYATGRNMYEYNITSQSLNAINGDSTSLIASVDVDSKLSQVYWVDGQNIRRAAIPRNSAQIPETQVLCSVGNAMGIAVDWMTRCVACRVVTFPEKYEAEKIKSEILQDFFQKMSEKVVIKK